MSEIKVIKYAKADGEAYSVPTFEQSSFWIGNVGDVAFRFSNYQHAVEHTHKDFCEIFCIISGEILNYINGKSVLMKKGDCCLVLRDDKHALIFPKKTKQKDCLFINFVMRWEYFLRLKHIFGEKEVSIFEEGTSKYFSLSEEETTRLLNKTYLLQTPDDVFVPELELDCKLIIIDLLKFFVKQKQKGEGRERFPDWLTDLLKILQNIAYIDKSLEDIVEELPYSYSYIAKEFKKYLGCSMVEYFAKVKLRYARELILNTDKKIIEVSLMVGYSSLSHFNDIFKKEYGVSPKQLRNQKNILEDHTWGKWPNRTT